MIIKVTQSHIDKALSVLHDKTVLRCENCPVALAIKDATGYDDVTCGRHSYSTYHKTYAIPRDAALKILKFDNDGFMEPFEFEHVEG